MMNFHEAAAHFETDKGPRLPTDRAVMPPQRGGPAMLGHGYTLVYEREFPDALARTDPAVVHLLEIGVQMGCSLRLWDWYFADLCQGASHECGGVMRTEWKIVGLDVSIVPGLKKGLDAMLKRPERVFLEEGDSTKPETAALVKARHGPLFDIVIDDGSHYPEHQVKTFLNFWPLVKPGGIYCLEDLHQSWWPRALDQGSILPFLHNLISDCLGRGKWAEWSGVPLEDFKVTYAEEQFFRITEYRNMVVFEKRQSEPGTQGKA